MKHFASFNVLSDEAEDMLMAAKTHMTTTLQKQPPLLEDLRNHSPEQLAELRLLLASDAATRPDPRRPGFFEVFGDSRVFYVFKYPTGAKVLLIGVWDRDFVAEMVTYSGTAA
jgi:hypothetical protein